MPEETPRQENWKQDKTAEGQSPFRPIGEPEPPEVEPEEDQQPLVEAEDQGGISWEEKRKALRPAEGGSEQELYEDSQSSERQNADMKKTSWQAPEG